MDKNDIVVGQPLPYSVYGPDRLLLLAQGQLVKSERVREALLRVLPDPDGIHRAAAASAAAAKQDEQLATLSALSLLRRDYQNLSSRARFSLRMAREEGGESYLCWVVGIANRRDLIITAPQREDRTFVTVTEGQSWVFRTFYATAVFRFNATIQKLVFDPFPYLHIQLPQAIDMRSVRKMPRAQVCLNATVGTATEEAAALIVDMSVTGLRLAVPDVTTLFKDQTVALNFTVPLLGKQHTMRMQGRVMSCQGASDVKHPRVAFYGLNVEPAGDLEPMVLHGYVQQQLVGELDSLWQALSMDSKSV